VYAFLVSVNLPLKEMSLQDKLAAMELLWEDLSRSPEAVASPASHEDVLAERRQRVAEGSARFDDWEAAKTQIRKKLR
jgi:hypothetical protein